MAITLDPEQIGDIAARHERARTSRQLIKRITLDHPDMTLDDAYACQKAWTDLQVANGAIVRGHKIGLTSRAMQQAMKIDEPDFGVLFDYMFVESGATLTAADYLDPKIEVELAFVLGRALGGPDVTVDDVHAATDHIVPALELIDARSHRIDPDDRIARGVRDTIADNAADAGVITGGRRLQPGAVDLRWVAAILKRNDVVEETGVAAAVLDDPAMGIVWLARRLAGYGITLETGETILAGSFTRPVDCRAGDHFEVDYADLGVITVDFV